MTTNPLVKDTDKDGLGDGREVKGYKIKQKVRTRKGSFVIGKTRSNPRKKDTDRDGALRSQPQARDAGRNGAAFRRHDLA